MKDLANSFFLDSDMNFLQATKRLHYLGWDDIELDYHTFQLAKECLEKNKAKDLSSPEFPRWIQTRFSTRHASHDLTFDDSLCY